MFRSIRPLRKTKKEGESIRHDLTRGGITGTMLRFALPMIAGNMLQQVYNIVDTLIVGQFVGADALAAVGSAYTLMTFLTSLIIGLCMGCGAVLSSDRGSGSAGRFEADNAASFVFVLAVTAAVMAVSMGFMESILRLLSVPQEVLPLMRAYVRVILTGLFFVFLYNYFAYLSRAMGNSAVPLAFLALAAVMNIVLDLWFVLGLGLGVSGAAWATVLSQAFSGIGICLWMLLRVPESRVRCAALRGFGGAARMVSQSVLTCMQQSVMNFGILMIQGLVNSFGAVIMAAFAAAVKIDTLAYMPAQEFANAYSLFISQNFGAGKAERVRRGTKSAVTVSVLFCLTVSAVTALLAPKLMMVFVNAGETEIIRQGAVYLRTEGCCYCGIGMLMLLYGYFRGIERPQVSLLLTVISLGTRVAVSYALAHRLGVQVIWWSIPLGWCLADLAGFAIMKRRPPACERNSNG